MITSGRLPIPGCVVRDQFLAQHEAPSQKVCLPKLVQTPPWQVEPTPLPSNPPCIKPHPLIGSYIIFSLKKTITRIHGKPQERVKNKLRFCQYACSRKTFSGEIIFFLSGAMYEIGVVQDRCPDRGGTIYGIIYISFHKVQRGT